MLFKATFGINIIFISLPIRKQNVEWYVMISVKYDLFTVVVFSTCFLHSMFLATFLHKVELNGDASLIDFPNETERTSQNQGLF